MPFTNSPLAPGVRDQITMELALNSSASYISANYGVSLRTVYNYRDCFRAFGTVLPPRTRRFGPVPKLDHEAREGIVDYLLSNKTAYIDEVHAFVQDQYDISVSWATVQRAVKTAHLTRKVIQKIALERNVVLRDRFTSDVCHFTSEQLVFVDESASNERTADRRWGWSTRGDPCRVRQSSKRSKRWSILPAITIHGYLAWEIYQDSFTTERFNKFIRQDLLPLMTAYPGPRSVLIMDNHSIHHSDELTQLCAMKGVVLLYLPPYSPDMNPIEQSFAQLKAWMRRNQQLVRMMDGSFENFIQLAIRSMSERSCRGHFRKCGYGVPDDEDNDSDWSRDNSEIDSE